MKFVCISVKSKSTFALLLFLVIIFFVALDFVNINSKIGDKIITNEDRVRLINSLGFDVEPEAVETKKFKIPEMFSDVYNEYNELQKSAGFNLKDYSGYVVDIYKYKIFSTNEEKFVNIILYDGVLIGGDVSSALLGGEMLPLR